MSSSQRLVGVEHFQFGEEYQKVQFTLYHQPCASDNRERKKLKIGGIKNRFPLPCLLPSLRYICYKHVQMNIVPSREAFTDQEWEVIKTHRTPAQVQRFLSSLPYNREHSGPSLRSFREVIRCGRAHCLEAALAAAVILEQHEYPPLLLSLASQDELDHVIFIFQKKGLWGAVGRSRDIGLHGRRPVFRTVRALAWSYFDPYVDNSGRIIGYGVANLHALGNYDWRFSKRNVWKVERYLQEIPHRPIKSSEKRYQQLFARYQEFHRRHPDKSPTYYANRHQWMR